MWDIKHKRFQDLFQAVLIVVLLSALLITGGYSVTYLLGNNAANIRYQQLEKEYSRLLKESDLEVIEGVERRLSPVEGRVAILQKRVSVLEDRVQELDAPIRNKE